MAKFRKRVKRAYSFAKRRVSHRKAFGGGALGKVASGAIVGLGLNFGAPMVSGFIPQLGPVRPTTTLALGAGAVGKFILHKDPMGISSAALVLGGAMLVQDVLGGNGGASSGSGGYYG